MRPGTPSSESGRNTTGSIASSPDASVDDIHLLEAARGAHVDPPVLDHEVAPLDQLHAHLARQEDVLEVGGVEDARA